MERNMVDGRNGAVNFSTWKVSRNTLVFRMYNE